MKKTLTILLTVIILTAALVSCDIANNSDNTIDQISDTYNSEETTKDKAPVASATESHETTTPETESNETTAPETESNETTTPETESNETTAPETTDKEPIQPTEPELEPVDAFIAYFNNYLKNACDNQPEDLLTSNTSFTNFTYSGSMSRDLGVKSIDVYMDGLSCYAADIGFEDVVYEYYFIRTSDGLILFKNNNGEYAFGGQEITDDCQHNNQLPMLTCDDVTLNANNTITISDNYMKRLYTAWVESDVESSWTAGYYSIDYALIVDLIKNNESANFNTTLSFADDGTINAYSIMLSDGENIYYTFDFENSDIKTTVKLSMNTSWTINSEFVYVKGESGYATFDVEVGREVWQSSYDYQVRVDVLTNIPDFEYDNELKEMIDQAKRGLTLQDAAAEKYAGEFTCEDSCAIMCYDAELDAYMLFSTNEGEAYQFMGATTLLPNFYLEYACFGSVDMNTRTLTVTKHSNDETVTPALLEKYAGTYTINQTTETDSVIVFDVDTERYVIFEYVDEEHVVCSGVVFCGEEKLYEGIYPVAIADITNKTITVQ